MPSPLSPKTAAVVVSAAGMFILTLLTTGVSHGKPRTHRVYAGQTLGMIAKRYNVTVQALRNANGLAIGRPIKPKQELIIPERDDADGSRARELAESADQSRTDAGGGARSSKSKTDDHRDASRGDRTGKSPATAKPAVAPAEYTRKPSRPGYVVLSGTSGRWQGQAVTRKGKVPESARLGFAKVLASWRTGNREVIDEQLIRLITRVSDHFGGRPVRIVSGYRPWSASQYTPHSRHNLGQAVDFSIPGVPNMVVRDYCRSFQRVGVGYYPNSSFVHLDVRETKTYWVDFSGPGEAPRYADGRGRDPAHSSGPNIHASVSRPIGGHEGPSAGSVDTQARPSASDRDLQ